MARFAEYPKMVYNSKGHHVQINGPDEMPEGYMTFAEWRAGYSNASASAAAGAVQAADAAASRKAADEAQAARDAANAAKEEAAAAEKAHRDELKAFLDEHSVDYVPQLGTPKLEELVEKLKEHLAAQEADDDGE